MLRFIFLLPAVESRKSLTATTEMTKVPWLPFLLLTEPAQASKPPVIPILLSTADVSVPSQ